MRVQQIILDIHGSALGPRNLGKEIAKSALSNLKNDPELLIDFRMEKITSLSSGFAFDLFGHIFEELGDQFSKRIRFTFGQNQNESAIKAIILRALSSKNKNISNIDRK